MHCPFFTNRSYNAYGLYVHTSSLKNLPQKMCQCILRQCAQTLVCSGSKLCTCATFSPRKTGTQNDILSSGKKHARLKQSTFHKITHLKTIYLGIPMMISQRKHKPKHCHSYRYTPKCQMHRDNSLESPLINRTTKMVTFFSQQEK